MVYYASAKVPTAAAAQSHMRLLNSYFFVTGSCSADRDSKGTYQREDLYGKPHQICERYQHTWVVICSYADDCPAINRGVYSSMDT